MRRLPSLLFLILLSPWLLADTFTIVFNSNSGADASSTSALVDELIADGEDLVADMTANNIYLGKSGYGLKFGTSTKKGEIHLYLTDTYQPTRVSVRAAVWSGAGGDDAQTIVVNNQTITLTGGTVLTDYTVPFDDQTNPDHLLTELSISAQKANKNRFYLQSVTIEADDPRPNQIGIIVNEMLDLGFAPLTGTETSKEAVFRIKGKKLASPITATVDLADTAHFSIVGSTMIDKTGGELRLRGKAVSGGIYSGKLRLQAFSIYGSQVVEECRLVVKVLGQPLHLGTLTDPYTPTDAIVAGLALKDGESSQDSVYIRGVVSGRMSCTQGEADLLLTDSVSRVKVYKMRASGNDVLEDGMLNSGDTVLIRSLIHNYKNTIEIYKGTLIESAIFFDDWGEVQEGYYDAIDGLSKEELKDALQMAIYSPMRYTYGSGSYRSTWAGFYLTDRREEDNSVMDMYSNTLRFFDPENPYASVAEMDIEHILPKSWWGGDVNEAYQDLHHLVPADYSANRSKSNLPPGKVVEAGFDNLSFKTGTSAEDCPADKVFEPADEYKGDFARAYFYIATAYPDLSWDMSSNAAQAMDNNSYLEFQPWLYELLLDWHRQDPVSAKEISRQKAVSRIQHNRNPFIDYPCLAEYIWGNRSDETVDLSSLLLTLTDEYLTTDDKSGCTCQHVSVETISRLTDSLAQVSVEGRRITGLSEDMKIWSVSGQEMTSMNGSLPAGLYIVSDGQAHKKLLVR